MRVDRDPGGPGATNDFARFSRCIVDPASRFTLKVRLVFGFLFGRPSTMADSISQNVEASNLSTCKGLCQL